MPIINQTASLSGVSNSFGLFIGMISVGVIIIALIWILSQFRRG